MTEQQLMQLVEKGKEHFDDGDYFKAKEIFESLLEISEDDCQKKIALCYLAEIYSTILNVQEKAIKYYQDYLKLELSESEQAETNFKLGELFYEKLVESDKYTMSEAIEIYEEASYFFEKSRNIKYEDLYKSSTFYLNECYYMLGRYEDGITVLKELDFNSLKPDELRETYYGLGSNHFALHNFKKAIFYLEKIDINIYDENTITILILLGKAYYLEDMIPEALDTLLKGLSFKYSNSNLVDEQDTTTIYSILEEILYDLHGDENIIAELIKTTNNYPNTKADIIKFLGNLAI